MSLYEKIKKKKLNMKELDQPENELESHENDPIDELVEENETQVDGNDENMPSRNMAENSTEIKFPETLSPPAVWPLK